MQLGMIGLGRMGANMVRRLLKAGHDVRRLRRQRRGGRPNWKARAPPARRAWRTSSAPSTPLATSGSWSRPRSSTRRSNSSPRSSLPATSLIDGGNSWYRDDVDRAAAARGGRHPLRRRRHQRRCVRPRAGLLPDGRRQRRGGGPTGADLRHVGARTGDVGRTPGRDGRAGIGRAGLVALRPDTAPATSSRWCTTASSTA